MKNYYKPFLILLALFIGQTSVSAENNDSLMITDSTVIEEAVTDQIESATDTKSDQEQGAENSDKVDAEIPIVFAQWWFWVGLLIIIVFIKYVVFKK